MEQSKKESVILSLFKKYGFKLLVLVAILIAGSVIAGAISGAQTREQFAQDEKDKKAYVQEQKKACMDIYETEGKKWNNVSTWDYDEYGDSCEITYREQNPKSPEVCEKEYAEGMAANDAMGFFFATQKYNCLNKIFTKTF